MMCVPGCNSIQWNLGTITHELSHRIISGTLDNLYRRAFARIESEDSDIHTLAGYFEVPCVTMEDVCEKLLAMTLTTMHIEDFTEEQYKSESNDPLLLLKQAWTGYSREIEEIAVHIFDYYHFYSMQAPQYVESVWRSWAVQPSIRSKLQHYVMRSVTALSIQYFSKPDWKQQAIDEFTMLMNSPKLRKIPFSKEVFEILELEKGDHEIAHYLTKMRHLITVFHFVLKSPELSLLCNGDPYLGKTKGGRSVYSAKERMFGGASADNLRPEFKNPLLFLKSYSQAAKPDAGASAWLFHMLAFNIHEEGTEKLA
jgi:hypothetical protein